MKRKKNNLPLEPHNIWSGGTIVLIVLAVLIVIVMIIAWAMPEASNLPREFRQQTQTAEAGVVVTNSTESATPADPVVLTRDDVGYGDGIIVFSSGLILLLLLVVFREQIIHRRRARMEGASKDDASQPTDQD